MVYRRLPQFSIAGVGFFLRQLGREVLDKICERARTKLYPAARLV